MADPTAVLLAAAAVASFVSFSWLALAMDAHWHQVQGGRHPSARARRALRGLGSAGLAASLALCLVADHPTIAVLVWIMLLPPTALAVSMTLTWRPALLRALWPAGRR